jgi:hypothetical protein
MTGEMSWNDLKDYPDMIELTKEIQKQLKIGAELRPFDVYQGPFIAVDFDRLPLRKKGFNLLSSWQVDVWQDEYETFAVEYKHEWYKELDSTDVIYLLMDFKEQRSKAL